MEIRKDGGTLEEEPLLSQHSSSDNGEYEESDEDEENPRPRRSSSPSTPHLSSSSSSSSHNYTTAHDGEGQTSGGVPSSEETVKDSGKRATPFCDGIHPLALKAAALLIEDALYGRKERHKMDLKHLRLYWLYTRSITALVWKFFVVLDLSLSFFEYPYTITPPSPYIIPPVELLCMLVLVCELLVRIKISQRRKPYLLSVRQTIQAVTISATVIDIFISVPLGSVLRVTRLLRPWFLIYAFRELRTNVHTARKMVWQALDVLLLITLAILLFGICSTIIFSASDEGRLYFSSYWHSWSEYFAMLLFSHFPKVMLPAIDQFWGYVLVFVSYVFTVPWFLMAIALASMYDLYKEEFKNEVAKELYSQHQNLSAAWQLIGCHEKEALVPSTFCQLMKELRPGLCNETINFMFRLLDKDDDGYIIYSEFLRIVDLLDFKIKKPDLTPNLFGMVFPKIYNSFLNQSFIAIAKHWVTSLIFDSIMFTLLMWVIIKHQINLADYINDLPKNEPAECTIFSLLVLEMIAKIYIYGPARYIQNVWHKFDIVQLFLMFCAILFTANQISVWARTLKAVYLLQISRIFRILCLNKDLKTKLQNMVYIIPAMKPFLLLQLTVYYFFAQLGMQIWAGDMYPDNPLLKGSNYAELGYWKISFNSFAEALLCLFSLNLINNWNVIAEAFVLVSNSSAMLFFIPFQIIASIIIQNLMVAFVLEAYQKQTDIQDGSNDPIREKFLGINQELQQDGKPMWEGELRRSTRKIIRQILLEEIIEEEERFTWLNYLKKTVSKSEYRTSLSLNDSIDTALPPTREVTESSQEGWPMSHLKANPGDTATMLEEQKYQLKHRKKKDTEKAAVSNTEILDQEEDASFTEDAAPRGKAAKLKRKMKAITNKVSNIRTKYNTEWRTALRARMRKGLLEQDDEHFFHPHVQLDTREMRLQIFWNPEDLEAMQSVPSVSSL